MIDFGITQADAQALVLKLTPREREIAKLIAFGGQRLSVAAQLGISIKTVHTHMDRLLAKLGVTPHGIGRIWFAALVEQGL